MPAVAGRVQRRGGLGDVFADDGRVADLAVAVAELVVGEADGAGIVASLGLFQRAAVKRDRARLIAAGRGEAAVQTPERGEAAGATVSRNVSGVRPSAVAALIEVVLQQPRFGEHRPDGELVLAGQGDDAGAGRADARLRRRGRARAPPPRAPAAPAREDDVTAGVYDWSEAPPPPFRGGKKRTALRCETCFKTRRAVAIAARPGFRAVQVAAAAAGVRVLHFLEVEVLLPRIRALRRAGSNR